MLLCVLNFPLDVDGIIALNVALDVHLFALGNGDLLALAGEMGGH